MSHFDTSRPAKWFRMYAEFAIDPKVQVLTEELQRRYIMLLCLRCSNGSETLQDVAVACYLRISNDEWQATKESLMEEGLIDASSQPTAWDKRQFASDSSTDRVRTYRDKKKQEGNVTTPKRNVTVTPSETETETETETEEKKENPAPSALVPIGLWLEFVEMRKKIRKPMTPRAVQLIHGKIAKLKEEGNDPIEVVEQSIRNGWQDVFALRKETGNGQSSTKSFDQIRNERTDAALKRVLDLGRASTAEAGPHVPPRLGRG